MKKIPSFKTEQEEREFWETHDSTDYVDWGSSKSVSLPNIKLEPETETVQSKPEIIFSNEYLTDDLSFDSLITTKNIIGKSYVDKLAEEQFKDELCPLDPKNFTSSYDNYELIINGEPIGLANVDYRETIGVNNRVAIGIELVAIFIKKDHRGVGLGNYFISSIAEHLVKKINLLNFAKKDFDILLYADFDSPEGEAVFNTLVAIIEKTVTFYKEKLYPESTSTLDVDAGY